MTRTSSRDRAPQWMTKPSHAYIDGTPDPEAPAEIYLGSTISDGLQLDQAEALAYAILRDRLALMA